MACITVKKILFCFSLTSVLILLSAINLPVLKNLMYQGSLSSSLLLFEYLSFTFVLKYFRGFMCQVVRILFLCMVVGGGEWRMSFENGSPTLPPPHYPLLTEAT